METEKASDIALPQTFAAKYLGKRDATGLWGLKHTRKAVDDLVTSAKNPKQAATLPMVRMEISDKGVAVTELTANRTAGQPTMVFPIESISYGVQDVTYTRVVAMIVVKETSNAFREHPFQCHGFVCESKQTARNLTLTLAEAFKEFSKRVKSAKSKEKLTKRFAIDLRGGDELAAENKGPMPEDSEA